MHKPSNRLWIAGSGLRGSGYPNAWNTVQMLRREADVKIIELGHWQPENLHLWKITKGPRHVAALQLAKLLAANAGAAIQLLIRNRRTDTTYIPYPSIFLLWLLSWIPVRWRPYCICDAYITLWDTIYQDRKLGSTSSIISRTLLCVESRALRAAKHVIVDTVANADHVSKLFSVPRDSIHAFPLALASHEGAARASTAKDCDGNKIRILFIGTFVPLQGTEVIARAINMLRDRDDLEFIIIGDGQLAEGASQWLDGNPAVTWLRNWQPLEVIEQEMSKADICLGVFGGEGKATRVLPFKIYMALAAGKAIITQHAYSTPESTPALTALTCHPQPDDLADAIMALASNSPDRALLESQSLSYHSRYLSSSSLALHWKKILKKT